MAQIAPPLDTTIEVVTPENIAFQYQLAGPFRRLPAFLIDLVVKVVFIGLVSYSLMLIDSFSTSSILNAFSTAMMNVGWFVVMWSYGLFMESSFNGRTIGKWAMGIRVVSVSGHPITGLQAIIRNLICVADLAPLVSLQAFSEDLPPIYFLPTCVCGMIVMVSTRRMQRLGDLASGTMVVIDERGWALPVSKVEDERVPAIASFIPPDYRVTPSMSRALALYAERRTFLSPARRRELARHLARPLAERFEFHPDFDHDLLLYALYWRTFLASEKNEEPNISVLGDYSPLLKDAKPARKMDASETSAPPIVAAPEIALPTQAKGQGGLMNIVQLLEERRKGWRELEDLCDRLEKRGRAGNAENVTRFASLYRAACADLALAEAYQLPPANVSYLHRLVGRAHNQLYRSQKFTLSGLVDMLLNKAPRQIFSDPCVRICAIIFFGLFWLSMAISMADQRFPNYPNRVAGEAMLDQLESGFAAPLEGNLSHYLKAASYYIRHNTGIGLQCFAFGILIIPCIFTLAYNGAVLGAAFGYMAREGTTGGDNFFHFVTAHGPFELTAIALSGAAGLRVGLGLLSTMGLTRGDSLRLNTQRAIPIIAAAAVLFFLAAMTEGFLSPSPAPYTLKAMWAIFSSGLLTFYFVVLGFPRDSVDAT